MEEKKCSSHCWSKTISIIVVILIAIGLYFYFTKHEAPTNTGAQTESTTPTMKTQRPGNTGAPGSPAKSTNR